MIRRLIWACLAALIAAVGSVGTASAQSLTEALAEAYRTNPQLLAQRALLRATDEMVPQALANWRPTVAFTGQTGYSVSASSAAGAPTAYSHSNPSSLDLTATQQVYRGGRTEAQVRQAIDTVEATRAQDRSGWHCSSRLVRSGRHRGGELQIHTSASGYATKQWKPAHAGLISGKTQKRGHIHKGVTI